MPVYSTNGARTISSTRIVAAEGYTDHDFGRIISETYENDMRVFNLGLARDFKEAATINENTMVSSELKALREFSVKEAFNSIKEKLKKLWAKIKGVFRNVYAKLSVWLNRSNKLYVAQNRKALEKKDCRDCPIPKYSKQIDDVYTMVDNYTKALNVISDTFKNIDSKVGIGTLMKKCVAKMKDISDINMPEPDDDNYKVPSSSELYEALEKDYFEKPSSSLKFRDAGVSVSDLLNRLGGSSKYLKALKKASKASDDTFKKIVAEVDRRANFVANQSKSNIAKEVYPMLSKMATFTQSYLTNSTSATIKLIKKAISNDRGLIATLVAYDPKAPKNEAVLMSEVAFSIGAMAFTEETEDMTDEDLEDAAQGGDGEVSINIEIDGTADADVNVEDNTGED